MYLPFGQAAEAGVGTLRWGSPWVIQSSTFEAPQTEPASQPAFTASTPRGLIHPLCSMAEQRNEGCSSS